MCISHVHIDAHIKPKRIEEFKKNQPGSVYSVFFTADVLNKIKRWSNPDHNISKSRKTQVNLILISDLLNVWQSLMPC